MPRHQLYLKGSAEKSKTYEAHRPTKLLVHICRTVYPKLTKLPVRVPHGGLAICFVPGISGLVDEVICFHDGPYSTGDASRVYVSI